MAGRPLTHARKQVAENAILKAAEAHLRTSDIDAAIVRAWEDGKDPALLMFPAAKALHDAALAGDVAAIKEIFDRVSGKVAQGHEVDEGQLEDSLEAVLQRISERRKAMITERVVTALPSSGVVIDQDSGE